MTTDAQKCPILLLMSSNRQNRVLTKKFFRVQLAQKSPLPHVADVAGVAATSATPWRSWLPRPPRCGRGTATLTRRKRGKRGCHATATPLPHLDVTATRGSHAPSHAHNGLRIRYTQRYVYAIHALTVSCGYQTQPTYGGLLQLVPCVAHAWFSQLAGTFPKPQTRLPA